ncbi:MAG TPA: BTAD domain-containing putative transcriptional regulator [Gaiellaceae bacterium]|nr:BTAD domain-containing putative transcriptional regulator [Gaiellaceae bacterium]
MERDGLAVEPPRGHKAWGLLTYLVRSRVAPSRERLASLLFPEADDPLGALRWTLSALRGRLGRAVEVGGDPLRLALPSGTFVDVEVLSRGSWPEAVALPGLGHELLDGLAFRSSPGFEMWLENERRHVAGTTSAVLHQAALARLARGEVAEATHHASELVRLNPYDENAHVLLVRCLRAAGDLEGAARQVEACTELFRRELGIDPTPALRATAAAETPAGERVSGRAAALAQVEAGESALSAGAVEAGLQRLRGAVAASRNVDDPALRARALVALGGALVHAPVRGADEEGAAALHEGTLLAEHAGTTGVAATGWREISWVQFLRAHYERAEESLARTAELADGNEGELAWVALIRGASAHDVGDHATAAELLPSAVARSERLPSGQPLGLALTFLGRFHLLRGELEEAQLALDRAMDEAEARGMTAFVPFPESFSAELDLVRGNLDRAEERFEHAFALGCQVGDPCWESVALRGLGLVAAARGDLARALEILLDAPRVCRRLPDTYLWIEVYGLDALCSVGVEHRAEGAPRWIDELEATAARRGMRELLLHAALYRARLGEPGALDVARSLAAQIDNPAVPTLLEAEKLSRV